MRAFESLLLSALCNGKEFNWAGGVLKPSGRFAEPPGPDGFELAPGNRRTAITGRDVDAFQRAKAATAAAMAELLSRAGMGWSDLRRLCVCGAFGRHLDVDHAREVGLLPRLDTAAIELVPDATLTGCEIALLDAAGENHFKKLTDGVKPLNLSLAAGYEERYIHHLRLAPVPPVA